MARRVCAPAGTSIHRDFGVAVWVYLGVEHLGKGLSGHAVYCLEHSVFYICEELPFVARYIRRWFAGDGAEPFSVETLYVRRCRRYCGFSRPCGTFLVCFSPHPCPTSPRPTPFPAPFHI